MERALSSIDTLSMILSNADRNTQACSARVSKRWFNPAARNIWSSIEDIHNILSLLPAVRYDRENSSSSSRGQLICYEAHKKSDWARFNIYKNFVKKLSLDCSKEGIVHKTLSTLTYTNSVKSLLPKLVDLTISSGPLILDSLILIHKGLKNVTINNIDDPSIHFISAHVLPRLSCACSLELHFNRFVDAVKFDSILCSSLRKMTRLEKLDISDINITQNMLLSIATLPKLRRLACNSFGPVHSIVKQKSDLIMKPADEASIRFSLLETVSIKSKMDMMSLFLSLGTSFSCARDLNLEITDATSEKILRCSLENIASKWSSLSYLSLTIQLKITDQYKELKYHSFRCLSSLHQLRGFDFYYAVPLMINDSEIEDLTRNWPLLERFNIRYVSSKAYYFSPNPNLTLRSFESFAKHCKQLKEIRIYLNARKLDDLEYVPEIMGSLRIIAFDFSPIKDGEAVAVYLSQFITPSCRIVFEKKVPPGINDAGFKRMEVMEEYENLWRVASKTLQTVLKVAGRERRSSTLRLLSTFEV